MAMARYPALTPRLHEVVEDQLKLLQAIIRGDAQTAQEVAAAHVRNFQVAFQEVMLLARINPRVRPRRRSSGPTPQPQLTPNP